MNSLAILVAAAFYFWQGIEPRSRGLIVLAAGILNVALALLWRELSWTDPQFYMIPVAGHEQPRDPGGRSFLLLAGDRTPQPGADRAGRGDSERRAGPAVARAVVDR